MSEAERLSVDYPGERRAQRRVSVYDRRRAGGEETTVETSGFDFNDFLALVTKRFSIPTNETFVLTTTDRTVLDFDTFEELQDGKTLYLLQTEDQELPAATKEHIVFLPHYHTLVQSGMYKYYASEGQKALPYALAELIDNALSATAHNNGERTIEIRLLFDDTLGKPTVVFLDNGCGMTAKQLNNWAVYHLSKFTREDGKLKSSDCTGYVRPGAVPRSLNSDISYFGVGGKQAVFYIGNSTRMITRPIGFPDVHELILSKDDFERKEKNKEDIYSGFIQNRKVGDSSKVRGQEGERFLQDLIAEETEKESFTAVVITDIHPEHITFLKNDFNIWTRELAHIYHYYIHGTNGNVQVNNQKSDINIQISMREKPTKCPRVVNLREVDNDMQTLYINSAADTFEFKARAESGGTVEGVLRYHPFLYDRETYPQDPGTLQGETYPQDQAPPDDEQEEGESGAGNQASGHIRARHIFECFWNGRLIPYTTISELEWCHRPSKHSQVPAECYSRFSGVLFADDRFQVSTNKLTFMDLELQLRNKETIFTCVVNKQEQRVKIQKEFTQWLKSCHETWDKQVRFLGFKGTTTRADVTLKRMQSPWATFSSIEWDHKEYKTGQLVKSLRTQPIVYGSIVQFLLYGDKDEDVYATGGEVEVSPEPKTVCDENKIFLISKIDRTATSATIKKVINNELAKLPDKLKVGWPEGNPWSQNAVQPAGTTLGPVNVEILNKKGESISRMPSSNQEKKEIKKLALKLTVVWHGPIGDQELHSHIAQHSSKWAYWFKAIVLSQLGSYTLDISTVLNDSYADVAAGKRLPNYNLRLSITEGKAERFVVEAVNSVLHVGVAFDMVLTLMDAFENPVLPPPDLTPQLTCSGLDVSYENTTSSGTQFTIHRVKVLGRAPNYHRKAQDLEVALPGLLPSSQTLKISLVPGHPHSLCVTPDQETFTVTNGDPQTFNIEIHDEAGNVTAQPDLVVYCQVLQEPPVSVDCSTTGAGLLVTKPISMSNLNGEHRVIKVKFYLPSQKHVSAVWKELKVVPSSRVSSLEVYFQDAGGVTVLKDRELVEWQAGDLLVNLYYRLYDEGRRLLPLSLATASKMKVNWVADMNLEDLAKGMLPNIQVPRQVTSTRLFCQISYQDQRAAVDTSFSIGPHPDAPSHLRATLDQASVKMGEVLPGDIHLQLLDQYENVTQKMTTECVEHITVQGEDLDDSSLTVSWQESSQDVVVRGVRFGPGRPGPRELTFSLRTLVDQVKVMVTAGPPAKLQLVSGPPQPLQVLNEQGIPSPFIIQLCDMWGNPSPDKRVVVALTPSSPTLKVECSVMSQPVDQEEGKASFTVQCVAGQKGEFSLDFGGLFNQQLVPGPSVPLTLVLDANKPASLAVHYDSTASYPAGGTFPVFSVTVLSEEGGPIRKVNPATLSMFLWRAESSTPPASATPFKCSKPPENEKDHFDFHFRDKPVPQQVGRYRLQFFLKSGQKLLSSQLLSSQLYVVDVVANKPIKLAPDNQPTTPVVSNSEEPDSRVLVKDLTLRIRDMFGNPTGQEVEGQVEVRVGLSSGDRDKDLPLLEAQSAPLQLTQGTAHVSKLCIERNSPGCDGTEYVLLFDAQIRGTGANLGPYELPFRFYNDADSHRRMSELSRRKDELSTALVEYRNFFKNHADLLTLLTSKHQDASKKQTDLSRRMVCEAPLESIPQVVAAISAQETLSQRLYKEPRRTCSISPYQGTHEVLGKVCHLALVEDEASAGVISWFIQSDMDCVVTVTTAAARRIFDSTQGGQQVLPLDSIYVNPNNRPLPHLGGRTPWVAPPGNPVFARDLLIFPRHTDSCQKVFKNFLGDTILIDDLDSGNAYRKTVVQSNRPCPTILTRQGDQISSKGKFGGAQNRAPALGRLQGRVFGAPLPAQYHSAMIQIALLNQYHQAMLASQTAKAELDALPCMVKKKEQMEEISVHLGDIVSQLECTSVRTPRKRAQDVGQEAGAGEQAGTSQKRPRGRL